MPQVEELSWILWASNIILPKVVSCASVGWKEPRPYSILDIYKKKLP